ncbi:MAG: FAD-dependent thymidylate synthase [Candidatus Saccharibacteria bacterium]
MSERGVFIAIEGTDGSGKGTQFKLLSESLQKAGYEVAEFDFPQYDQASSYFVKEYLNGNYGSSTQVNPYMSSLFYALDRYQAAPKIKQALNQGKIVLANRFTGSNMGHQGQKFNSQKERTAYYDWLTNIEYVALCIPKPDKNIVLRVPAEIAQKLVDKKETRGYTTKQRDLHEADINHLKRAVFVYDELCELFPNEFVKIDCVEDGKMLSVNDIQHKLMEVTILYLPSNDKPLLKIVKDKTTITEAGYEKLEEAVTNTKSNVYSFKSTFSPVTAAAAMARLSRRFNDLRITILDEFSGDDKQNEALLKRVITAYGDDSVQQLVGQHIVVESASNLLTKKIEWGRLAAYLEQSTRYIYYDQKDDAGNYKYYVPEDLSKRLRISYIKTMNEIFDNYSKMVHKTTNYVREISTIPAKERDTAWQAATRAQACDAIRYALPVATKSTVGIYASAQAIENLIMRLLADELPEARLTGKNILKEARKVMPAFLERADKPERGGAITAYNANRQLALNKLAEELLPNEHSIQSEEVTLVDYSPKNELDAVADMLYEHSNMSIKEISKSVDKWPYKQKVAVFKAYIGERLNRRQKPGRALENIHYRWDIICDYGIFRDLQRHRMVEDLAWQKLSPRFGYEIPEIVEKSGVVDLFIKNFDLSLALYSKMQSTGFELEAQYATLLGHKMRWKVSYNAREAFHLHELRTVPQGHPGYRKLVGQMHDKLLNVHPLLGESMIFVNKDEDPELTRLAAERYTQYKLNILD